MQIYIHFTFAFTLYLHTLHLPSHLQMTLILIPTRERRNPSADTILSATNFCAMPNFYQALFPRAS